MPSIFEGRAIPPPSSGADLGRLIAGSPPLRGLAAVKGDEFASGGGGGGARGGEKFDRLPGGSVCLRSVGGSGGDGSE